MNNELHIAYQIKQHLNDSLRALPADKTERLRAVREQALARQRKVAGVTGLQMSGASVADAGSVNFGHFEWLGHLVPVAVLAAGLLGISYWHQNNRAEENADIDTQMLIDELPPAAYADKGFGVWIKHGQE